jgi:hypothetical protein
MKHFVFHVKGNTEILGQLKVLSQSGMVGIQERCMK